MGGKVEKPIRIEFAKKHQKLKGIANIREDP